jgi:cytochrome c6
MGRHSFRRAFWLLLCASSSTNALVLLPTASGRSSRTSNKEHNKIRREAQTLPTAAQPATVAATAAAMMMMALVATPAAAAAGDISRGQQLFDANCAGCHLGGANFVSPERTLRQDALVKYGIGVEPASILSFVTKNSPRHQNLVFFRAEGGKLNPQQWEDVTTYIADQAQGDKWP